MTRQREVASATPLALSLALAACSGPRVTCLPVPAPAAAFTPVVVPIEYVAPTCSDGGPSVEILRAHRFRCGKGNTCTSLDQRIRNPEDRALWLMLDSETEFSGYVESVRVVRARLGDGAPVWSFSGQNVNLAFRILPGTDVVVRNVEYTEPLTEFRAAFVDRIALNYDQHFDWSERDGALPLRGEVDARGINGAITDYDGHDVARLDGKERVSLDTWCVRTVPVVIGGPGPTD
jgi:hypothetical protein